ncbi:Sybindin-like protein [Coniochaeta hoffmannii]|uniref:Trafficking protein particle complex subunit n=1 Tax=Coniochaeta hoffmannii TaxID=91930 RepID=A0AA38RJL3_9PEZI|nr:Sybindin-like protein [Coniochaeta hoffmannii]
MLSTRIKLELFGCLAAELKRTFSYRQPEKRPDGRDDDEIAKMTVFALIIINKAGGLIYNKTFHEGGLNKINTNDLLVLAGTFHGVHAITARLNPLKTSGDRTSTASASGMLSRPEPPTGLEVLESENFRLQCFTTMTGVKFLLFTDTTQANVDVTIRRIYDLYADYVMKNPFYQLEMPVRCDMFDRKLLSYVREINNR